MIQTILVMTRAMIHDAQIDFNDLARSREDICISEKSFTNLRSKFNDPVRDVKPRKKLKSRTRSCLVMGYVHDTQKIWRVYDPVQKLPHIAFAIRCIPYVYYWLNIHHNATTRRAITDSIYSVSIILPLWLYRRGGVRKESALAPTILRILTGSAYSISIILRSAASWTPRGRRKFCFHRSI